ncbi:hypothetical protein AB0M02_05965 [Actinoplanes sp. NPDC051861]|uniref:hypothetical protein n=1 Tax=Actinoplanes sp. NPDC051861 TaxID=3155170 RepID=UPI00341971B3
MPVRALHTEINAVRALVADGLAEVSDATGDPDQFWIRSACLRLTAVDAALVEAAGTISAPVSVAAGSLITFGTVALVAALAQAAGFGTFVVVGLVTVVLLGAVLLGAVRLGAVRLGSVSLGSVSLGSVLLGAVPFMRSRARAALGRRRLARAGLPDVAERPGSGLADIGLIVVPESLERARVRLVSAALRQAGAERWTVPEIRLAARTDPALSRLAHADLLLCQAIDCLERYLDDLAKGWP